MMLCLYRRMTTNSLSQSQVENDANSDLGSMMHAKKVSIIVGYGPIITMPEKVFVKSGL